ncbi:MAG: IS21 family transposase [Chloroflexota bacterium]|nr:IS21 family transposase [Chloroflexota bacterium]
MERSTIHYLKQKGWTNVQIAELLGHHRDTIARVLREPVDQQPAQRQRQSAVAVFSDQIRAWLEQRLSVQRMLELARDDPNHPYLGSAAAFYDYVRPLRRARASLPATVAVRFEGLPGELLQIDWGEVRQCPFTHPDLAAQTRYFFAARLKYSRWMFVEFHTDMREETLLRCLIACFVQLGGVPWVVTTDNMKTVTLGRDAQQQPIWHPAFQKFAVEFAFHPSACAPAAGNQKGAVESLVKFVKGNFLAGRTFYDAADLDQECAGWLQQVNEVRPSDATAQIPSVRLAEERLAFGPLPAVAQDYGIFDSVVVNRESLVAIATNRYSVPAHLVGLALTARLYPTRIELFHGADRVASHPRHFGRNARISIPEHFEAVFALKPRARIMVYRDWLVALSPQVADYISQVCRKRYAEMDGQITALYELAQRVGREEFLAAVELAAEQQTVGAEYVCAIAAQPVPRPALRRPVGELPALLRDAPAQHEVERALADYEQYVTNRELDLDVARGGA